jgi:two-component system response regulator PilR (NtrC family)
MEKILVVDDELSMREFLEIMLKKSGYEVESVSDPEQAVLRVENDVYDLVITDILMPKMNGLELLRKIKEHSPTRSWYDDRLRHHGDRRGGDEGGAYDYITKPFKLDEIRLVIEKALEKKKFSRERALKQELKTRYNPATSSGQPEMLKVSS